MVRLRLLRLLLFRLVRIIPLLEKTEGRRRWEHFTFMNSADLGSPPKSSAVYRTLSIRDDVLTFPRSDIVVLFMASLPNVPLRARTPLLYGGTMPGV